jgi:4-hydroxybenzoate polyprenyltransferase
MQNTNGPLEYLKLFRLQTGATTALAPVIGYFIIAVQTNYLIDYSEIILIFIIGLLMHIFEFVLNEYIDENVDRKAPNLAEKPLVKRTISPATALGIAFGAMILAYILTIIFFFNIWTLIILTLAFEFGAIYDIYGKRFAGSDFTLALWIFLFCLFGASVVSFQFSGILYLVAGLGFFQILFNNAIEGGIKDSDHDALAGAHTLASKLGVRVKNKKLIIPPAFKVASYAIKIGYITIVALLFFVLRISLSSFYDFLYFTIIIFLIIVIFYTLNKFLNFTDFNRSKLKRIFSIHEIATFYLSSILLLPLLGLKIIIGLLLLPLIWYMALNLILYGKALEPRV